MQKKKDKRALIPYSLDQYRFMGVINVTPNSFSDGGIYLDKKNLQDRFVFFLQNEGVIPDIGFESTAPMNSSLTAEVEWQRFEFFLEVARNHHLNGKLISLDTYRPQSFFKMSRELQKVNPELTLIFNDVSGVLDEELQNVLTALTKPFYYVYSFTHIPDRFHVLSHMQFNKNHSTSILSRLLESTRKAYSFFSDLNLQDALIIDPGFGFSKSYEENWEIIDRWGEFVEGLEKERIRCPILVGLSRKSFLKKRLLLDLGRDCSLEELESLHFKCVNNIASASLSRPIFRVHSPENFIGKLC